MEKSTDCSSWKDSDNPKPRVIATRGGTHKVGSMGTRRALRPFCRPGRQSVKTGTNGEL
jgi:hypothetical protein